MEFDLFKNYMMTIMLFTSGVALADSNFTYFSNALETEVEISVSTPDAYDFSQRTYPVVFVFDGPGYFDLISEFTRKMYSAHKIPELIVVSVPTVERFQNFVGDSHKNYSKFVKDELAGVVKDKYRSNGLFIGIGHSLGASYLLRESILQPQFFSRLAISSPVVSERVGLTIGDATKALENICKNDGAVFVSKGNERGVYEETIPVLVSNKNLTCLSFKHFIGESHASLPLIAPYFALSTFFKTFLPPTLSDPGAIRSLEDIEKFGGYEGLKLYYNTSAGIVNEIPDILISRLAFTYVNLGKKAALLNLFEKEALNRSQLIYWVTNKLKAMNELDLAITLLKLDESTNPSFKQNRMLLAELMLLKEKT